MALIRPGLLVACTVDIEPLDAAGFVAAGEGAGSVVVPDWKYEQPETASAASKIRERII
jgi:hypothetical protein